MEGIKKALNVLDDIKEFWSPSKIPEIELAINVLRKQIPRKPKIWESSRYEDGEPLDNIICGNCDTTFITGIEWQDLYDNEKIKKIVEEENIEKNEWVYCYKCGQRIDWN